MTGRHVGESCGTCVYSSLDVFDFDSDGTENVHAVRVCQRYPPSYVTSDAPGQEGDLVRFRPQVDEDDWCGEFVADVGPEG